MVDETMKCTGSWHIVFSSNLYKVCDVRLSLNLQPHGYEVVPHVSCLLHDYMLCPLFGFHFDKWRDYISQEILAAYYFKENIMKTTKCHSRYYK